MKILFCGGHLTPALALIDYIKNQDEKHEIVFWGRKYSSLKNKQESHERQEILKRRIKFVRFDGSRHPILNLFYIFKALFLLIKNRPNVFVGFGGYLSLPIAIACFVLGIPVIVHEQTHIAGQSNKFIANFAKKVAVAFKDSQKYFKKEKIVFTGNPIRAELFLKSKKPSWATKIDKEKEILFVTGGNQGSFVINNTLSQILPRLLNDWNIVHICGNKSNHTDYKKELQNMSNKLTANKRDRYVIKEWASGNDLAWIYQNTTAMLSRAGANTINEIMAFKIPSVLIPLPFAKGDEQTLNAKYLSDIGAAIFLSQKSLSQNTLENELKNLHKYHKSMKKKFDKLEFNKDGAAKLWQLIVETLKS